MPWDELEWEIVRHVAEIETVRAAIDCIEEPVANPRGPDDLNMRRRHATVLRCSLECDARDHRDAIMQLHGRIGRLKSEHRNAKKDTLGEMHENRYRVPE
jgi:hypothetical protein